MAQGISIPVVQSGLEASIQQGARNVGTININASVDPSSFKNLAQPLGRVSGLATEFEKSIAASNARVLAFGASVGIINGVQNAFTSLVQTGIEVQKTLADIGAISGRSGAELSKFGDSLFEIGKITGQTFQTASQAALEFSRQGLNVEQTLKRTSDALTLTRFTTLSASEAVDVLTAAANSFSETGITTAQIINKLVAVDTKFAVSAEDLAKGLARAGSIAQEVGVNFDQLNAAVTVAQERTARGGAVIGNALKTIFTRLRSDETVQALRDIGVESLDAQGQLKGAIPLLEELSKKLQGLSGGERIQILEAVASKYNINILSALLNDLGDANSKFGQAVQVSAGAGNQAYERQIELNKTLSAQLNNATVSATQLLNKLSEIGVTQNLNSLLSFVNDLLSGFNKLLDSGSVGGDIAKGLIKGISDVFFTVGLPVLAAIFIKLTTDIAKFGVESLKTILGINQQVRERQALEQAVVNTLIRDQEVMASILALSGNRTKQEEYLLGVFNRQLTALQQVQSIASSVTPGLMAGGLSATSGTVKKRGAGGYLPSQEAADVRRGVGGASSSSKVVSIPNFAFGGGKRGTMVANTSEYVVPNFANGGSAIFNQDMARAYGLPAGAKKISAAGGYVPNFNRYVYDSDRIEPDKNSLLKAILASKAKKNLIVGPAGSGKSTYGASLGSFITNPNQLADATEIDILSGAARTKDGGTSKNFQQIADAVNLSGGKISYLYAGNMDILSRRRGRIGTGPDEGDLRSKKQIAGSMYAPLNQFDFISKVKSSAKNFEMIRGAKGYVPNFADEKAPEFTGQYAGIVPNKEAGPSVQRGKDKNGKLRSFPMVYAGSGANSKANIDDIRNEVVRTSKNLAIKAATDYAKAFDPDLSTNTKGVAEKATQANQNKGAIESFVGSIFEASIASLLSDKNFAESQDRSTISTFDFSNNAELQRIFSIPKSIQFLEAKNNALEPNLNKIAEKISKVQGGGEAFSQKRPTIGDTNVAARYFTKGETGYLEKDKNVFEKTDLSKFRLGPNQLLKNGLPSGANIRGALGYIPNFAQGGPLEDAIQREMAAGLDPSQIRITKDGKLKNSQNPNGFAVINTRDEPNGRVPNFARPIGPETEEQMQRREARNAKARERRVANSGQEDEVNKSLLTTNKLMLAFGGLTMITAQLQSNIKDTSSGFAQFTVGLSKALQSAAGYGSVGTMLSDTQFAKNQTAKGGMLGKVAGNLGVVGMVAGAGIGVYQAIQEEKEQAKALRLAGATERSNKKIQEIQETSTTPKEMEQRLVKEQTASYGKVNNFYQQRSARLRDKKSELSGSQLERDKINSEMSGTSVGSPKGLEAQKRTAELLQKEKDLKEEISNLGNSGRTEQDKEVLVQEDLALYLALQKVQDSIASTEQRIAKEKSAEQKILETRVPLEAEIYRITSAIAQSEADSSVKSARDYAQRIALAASLSSSAQEYNGFLIGRDRIQEKINGLEKENLDNVLTELAKKATVSVGKDELEILLKRLKNGKDIVNVQKELDRLGLGSLLTNKKLIQDENDKTDKKRILLKTEQKIYDINELSKIQVQTTNSLFKDRLSVIQQTIELQSRARSFAADDKAEKGSLNRQLKLKKVQDEIASKPFASNADKLKLMVAQNEFTLAEETAKINEAAAKRELNLYDEKSKKLTALVDQQNLFSQTQTETFKNQIKEAGAMTTLAEKTKALGKVRENVAASKLDLPAPVKPSESFDDEDFLLDVRDKYESDMKVYALEKGAYDAQVQQRNSNLSAGLTNELNVISALQNELEKGEASDKLRILNLIKVLTYEQKIAEIRAKSPARAGAVRAMDQINEEASNFQETFSYETTFGFRDGLRDAMSAAISQTDDLGAALQNVAMGFLKTMQDAFLRNAANNITSAIGTKMGIPVGLAKGGVVSGGSGYRDDVPAMLTGGEFVMRKSAVQKYGASNLERMNSGGMFVPGTRGGGAISGENDLRAFANQSTTSGATDALKGSRSSAFINLEDESQKLSRYALLGDDTINQEVRGAKMQAFDILKNKSDFEKQQKEAEKQQKKALVRQMIGTVAGAALSYGAGKLAGPKGAVNLSKTGYDYGKGVAPAPINPFNVLNGKAGPTALAAYGGLIRRYASGGPTDDIPAMLMSGEYVMNRGASRKYGKQFLDSMNQGRAPRFADGGEAAPSSPTTTTESNAKGMGDVSININVTGQTSQTETQGNSSQGGVDYKKMSEKIKMVVMETLNEEKRLGGSLRTR